MKNTIKKVQFRRKRKGKTNYKKRMNLLKSGLPRLVVRPSRKCIVMQIVSYEPKGDKVIAAVSSASLEKIGWKASFNNTPAAYLTGIMLAKKAKEKKIGEMVLDIGLLPAIKGGKVFAALKGAVDSGLKIPFSEEIAPDEKRISGKHISEYAGKLKQESKEKYEKLFSKYLKSGIAPEDMPKIFEETKKKIEGS